MKKTFYKQLINKLRKDSEKYDCNSEVTKLITALDRCSKSSTVKSACAAQSAISSVQKKIRNADLKEQLETLRRQLQSEKDKLRNPGRYEDYSYSAIGINDYCTEFDD
jgi:hypothetical protein